MVRLALVMLVAALAGSSICAQAAPKSAVLDNGLVRAEFGPRGLAALRDRSTGRVLSVREEGFSVLVGDATIDTAYAPAVGPAMGSDTATYTCRSGQWTARAIYELKPGRRFLTKRVTVAGKGDRPVRVRRVELLRPVLATPIAEVQRVRDVAFLRMGSRPGAPADWGVFVALQNPFLQLMRSGNALSCAYVPDLAWTPDAGEFSSDRVCIGPYRMSGTTYPAALLPEWKAPAPDGEAAGPRIDAAEVDAVLACVREFLLYKPQRSARLHVGWCENDYQIDISTAEGREEYKRIIDQAAAVGCTTLLFDPANSVDAPLEENRDAWGWENLLWFSIGQKLRKGEWDPAKQPLPETIASLVEYARTRGVKMVAYVYPSLPFMQDPAWTSWVPGGRPGGYLGADTGQRTFQDWLLDKMDAFTKGTGAGGYSFDHWWIAYDETRSSRYEQWAGARRIMEELRRRQPDALIDTRQQIHHFGVWTWLAGSYPHPLNSDEQPESFRAFPDLHWSRASADRQRRTAWYFRNNCFVPAEIMPGYMLHQTPRLTAEGQTMRTRFRPADWDLLGWKYSVLSSISTAPLNHVVNMLPARDSREFAAFGEADRKWLRGWLDWTDRHTELLRAGKPIASLGQPRVGGVDGWSACSGSRGFLFLFNPNYRALPADLRLDAALGLSGRAGMSIRQLYPDIEAGTLLPPTSGSEWRLGDRLSFQMPGCSVRVLEIAPSAPAAGPVVMGCSGTASLKEGIVSVIGARGEPGADRAVAVALPSAGRVRELKVNGVSVPFAQSGAVVHATVRFAGTPCGARRQIGAYDPSFTGGGYRAEAAVPARVWRQLADRKRAWPVEYTADERAAPWLNSDRLILYVQVADPNDGMRVTLSIDGKAVPLRPAYTSIVRSNPANTFVGWMADITDLSPDAKHVFELQLPMLSPGQFQGMFLDTVETEMTEEVAAAR